jgi:transposase
VPNNGCWRRFPWQPCKPARCEELKHLAAAQLLAEQVCARRVRVHPINLGSHKGKAVRRAIRAVGAQLVFLPRYSPDLNPIAQFFARLEHWLRKAASRTTDALEKATLHILATLTANECSNYFANAGYDQA